ncbi:LOW QUALITY PROTEIN: hypothetical protein AAY473_001580 [Plecturocebus cupreus]
MRLGSRRDSAPLPGQRPEFIRPQEPKKRPKGKEGNRKKGAREFGGVVARPDPGAGKMTSASKVEQVLLPPSPAGEHLCPSRSASQGRRRAGPQSRLRSAARPPARSSLRDAGERGLPEKAQVSTAAPRSGGKGPRPSPRAEGTQLPKRLLSPRRAWLGSRGPRTRIPILAPRPSSSTRQLRSRSLGSGSRPRLFSSAPGESSAPARRPGAPHSPHGERSRSAERAGAKGGGGRREHGAPHSGPCCPGRRLSWKLEAAAGCHLPALPPSRLTRAAPPPARRRQVSAEGPGEEPGRRAGERPGERAGPRSPRLSRAAGRSDPGAHRLLRASGAGRGTFYPSFRAQMPSLGGHLQADMAEWKLSSCVSHLGMSCRKTRN